MGEVVEVGANIIELDSCFSVCSSNIILKKRYVCLQGNVIRVLFNVSFFSYLYVLLLLISQFAIAQHAKSDTS